MERAKLIKGGAFLIESISPQEVFTPEDFNEEQRLVAKAATEFVVGEVQPVADDIVEKKEGLLTSLFRKAGELGFLSADWFPYGPTHHDWPSRRDRRQNLNRVKDLLNFR